jgi:hypothetical protein
MKRRLVCAMSVLVLGVSLSGCSVKHSRSGDDRVEALRREVLKVENAKGMAEAIQRGLQIISGLDVPAEKYGFTGWLAEHVLVSGEIEHVYAFIPPIFSFDEQLGLELVYWIDASMLSVHGDDWIQLLLWDGFPPALQIHGYSLWFDAHGVGASIPDLLQRVASLLDPFLAVHADALLERVSIAQLDHEDASRIWALTTVMLEGAPREGNLRGLALYMQGLALLRDRSAADAFAHYMAHAGEIGEPRLIQGLPGLLQKAHTDTPEVLGAIRNWVYGQTELAGLQTTLARWDMGQLQQIEDTAMVVNTTKDLLAKGAPVHVLASVFVNQLLYPALGRSGEDKEALGALRDLLLALESAADASVLSGLSLGGLNIAVMDVLFFLQDYKGALARVEAGVPGFDAEWHAESAGKLRAHVAQAEGRAADAVAYYAAHIERVRTWQEGVHSPLDNRVIIADEVIALNERRIGDIWKAAGEAELSQAAFERSIEHYRVAYARYGASDPAGQEAVRNALAALGVEL